MPGFHVLLADPTALVGRTSDVARAVARTLKQPVADVSTRVRSGGGIVARDLDEAPAQQVQAALEAAGMGAFVVAGALPVLPRARRLAGLVLGAEGLTGKVRGGLKEEKLPWARVRAFHVYALARDLTAEELEEGRPPRPLFDVQNLPAVVKRLIGELDYWEDRERKRVDLVLDLIAEDPLLVARIHGEDADYQGLPGKKATSSVENFLALARALVAAAPPHVVVPPTVTRFAEGGEWKGILFDKPEQRDFWNVWLVTAARAGRGFPRPEPPAAEAPVEEVDDGEVTDGDVAVEVGEDDAEGAEDLADDEASDDGSGDETDDDDDDEGDEDEDDDDETAEGAKGSSPKGEGDDAAALAAAGGDHEIAQTLELFDKTRKLRKSDVHAMLAAAAALDDKVVNDEPATPPEAPEVQIFEDRETGAWDVKDVLDESQALDEKDLENA